MTLAERVRGVVPARLKRNATLRSWVVPEEVVVALEAIRGSVPELMIDVGAHVGSTCVPFLESGWRVHAFEPDPENRARLEAAVAPWRDRIAIEALAVSDTCRDDVPFFTSPVSTGISGLHVFHASHRQRGTVSTVTLASYCTAHDVREIGLLKTDVEGFDLHVLRGLPTDRALPHAIVCEFDDAKTVKLGWGFHDLCRHLRELDYAIVVSEWYPSVRYGRPHRWRTAVEYPCELKDAADAGNLIAFRRAEHAQAALDRCRQRAWAWRLTTALRHWSGI